MNIGIIGSNGFLGQSLVKLIGDTHNLFLFNRSNSINFGINIFNYVGEISTNSLEFNDFILNNNLDTLIHMGEKPTYELDYLLGKQLYFNKSIFDGVIKNTSIKKIIYVSSMAVYGNGLDKKENDILFPDNNYGFVKKISERIFLDLINYGRKVIVLRPSNLYGIGSNSGVIHNFINSINLNTPITISGNGLNIRDYLYIDDCSMGILKAIYYNDSNIFNLSSGEIYSLNGILDILKNKFNINFEINYINNNIPNTSISEDINYSKKELKWEPKVNILDGLSKMLGKKYM